MISSIFCTLYVSKLICRRIAESLGINRLQSVDTNQSRDSFFPSPPVEEFVSVDTAPNIVFDAIPDVDSDDVIVIADAQEHPKTYRDTTLKSGGFIVIREQDDEFSATGMVITMKV